LMEKFEVCFRIKEDNVPFEQQRSIIPSLLGDEPPSELARWWSDSTHFGMTSTEKIVKFNVIPKEMVGRLLVRLHFQMEEKLIWKTGMYFDKRSCKALVRVHLEDNSLEISVKGSKRSECVQLMEEITNYMKSCASLYPSVTFIQYGRSTYNKEALIDLDTCLQEYNKPKNESTLRCPSTRQLVDPQMVLLDAGLIDEVDSSQKERHWWETVPDSKWKQQGEVNSYWTYEFIADGAIIDQHFSGILKTVLGGSPLLAQVKYAYALHNKLLLEGFLYFYKSLLGKVTASRSLFKKDDYKLFPDHERRTYFLSFFQALVQKYSQLNQTQRGESIHAIPMIQGTNEQSALSICQNGFATVATLDEGFYGKGIYFTGDLEYASKYAKETTKGKVFLVALTLPGNPFPVTENPHFDEKGNNFKTVDANGKEKIIPNPSGYYGKTARSGYQSHYTIVSKTTLGQAFPIDDTYDPKLHADELVVFQDPQALPLFLIYV